MSHQGIGFRAIGHFFFSGGVEKEAKLGIMELKHALIWIAGTSF